MANVIMKRTTEEWGQILDAMDVRYAPVNDYEQAANDNLVLENNYLVDLEDSGGNIRRVVGSPIKMSGTPSEVSVEAPELGQHTEEILLELGYNWEEISELRETSAI